MQRGKLDESILVPLVSDGAIANPDVADGRLIPVLIIDCSSRPEIYDLVLLHKSAPPGDVKVMWGRKIFSKKNIYLVIESVRPVSTKFGIRFCMSKHAGVVDGVIHARGFYLQPLQSGRRVLDGLDEPKILVEVPDSAMLNDWHAMHHASVVKTYRQQGASRGAARKLADEHLQRLSELWQLRQQAGVSESTDDGI
ncbi:hypothetical protein [Uliginosibacterium sp. H1]|uniref:hypothetical protein n=1 Tax=Uliginosibacterium sp. H1 TaxID=3114757 RepID=UPI002E170EA7|nr:hypothetical protein [Uliginosibacterium sp. H1]